MTKALIVFLLFFTLSGITGCSKVSGYFASGDTALDKAFAAKSAAKSFRMTTRMVAHDDQIMETNFYVSCPDRERITLKIANNQHEMIRIGQRFYAFEEGKWYYKDIEIKDWSPCGRNPGLPSPWALMMEGTDLLSVVENAKAQYKVTRGAEKELEGQKFQEWNVSKVQGGGGIARSFDYAIWVGQDGYPKVIGVGGGTMVTDYGDWNKPLSIEAPAGAEEYREPPDAQHGSATPAPRSGMESSHSK